VTESESDIKQAARLHLASNPNVLLWLNPIGYDKRAHQHYGIGGPGGSDTVGSVSIIITPAMVGRKIAVLLAIEFKKPGAWTEPKRLKAQQNYIRVVREAGGIAGFASSVAEAESIINASPGHQPEPA